MSDVALSNVRNFAILGHSGSGKTTLTDAVAFKLGINDRMGLVSNGSSVSDTHEEEKARQITIFSTSFTANHKVGSDDYKLVFTDTPGFMDFYGQMLGAASASDFALITVDASAGVQVGTRKAWSVCKEAGLKTIAFAITGLDKDNVSFDKTLEEIRSSFGMGCVALTAPGSDGSILSVLDSDNLPDNLMEVRNSLAEAAAETDEALMEKYFEEGTLPTEDIRAGVKSGIIDGSAHPVFATAPLNGTGVTELLDNLCLLFPDPSTRVYKDDKDESIEPVTDGPLVAYVWRTAIDPFMGLLSYVRIVTGTMTTGMSLQNTDTDSKETISAMLHVVGRKQNQLSKAGPGDIVALPKLRSTKTGNTLTSSPTKIKVAELPLPQPVMFMALEVKTQDDENKLSTAIQRLLDGDTTLQYEKQAETKQLLLKGLGDVHLDVAVALMKSQTNVNVMLSTPKVPYRETITANGEGHYRHKKQSGGAGQFGEVYLRVAPRLPGDESEWFADKTVGGSIPGNFIPAVQKGVEEGMLAGSVAGFPVQNINVEVYDGSFHPVDSKEIAFKIAGMRALREGMAKAKPVLLEPIMTLKITIPEAFMGAISGDLPNKRGRVQGMDADEGVQVITAEAPLAELFKYAAELRSITGGQGSFTMEFDRYDIVPANVAQKVIAEAAKDRTDDDDD